VEVACRNIESNNIKTQDAQRFQTLLLSLLEKSTLKMVELDTFIRSLTSTLPKGGGAHINSISWLKKKGSARIMVVAMKETKSNLHVLLETYVV
jgi:hypothetical protein